MLSEKEEKQLAGTGIIYLGGLQTRAALKCVVGALNMKHLHWHSKVSFKHCFGGKTCLYVHALAAKRTWQPLKSASAMYDKDSKITVTNFVTYAPSWIAQISVKITVMQHEHTYTHTGQSTMTMVRLALVWEESTLSLSWLMIFCKVYCCNLDFCNWMTQPRIRLGLAQGKWTRGV